MGYGRHDACGERKVGGRSVWWKKGEKDGPGRRWRFGRIDGMDLMIERVGELGCSRVMDIL